MMVQSFACGGSILMKLLSMTFFEPLPAGSPMASADAPIDAQLDRRLRTGPAICEAPDAVMVLTALWSGVFDTTKNRIALRIPAWIGISTDSEK